MAATASFAYQPDDSEQEQVSNGYLLFIVAFVAGVPLPIINLIGSLIYYVKNVKSSYYVRWHCTQALLAQLVVIILNSMAIWWTVTILLGHKHADLGYILYLAAVLLFNLTEFVITLHAAVNTRKGKHVVWWFFGPLTNLLCKPRTRREHRSR